MSTITNLQSTDNGADSLSIINTNLENLNTDKLESSDLSGYELLSNKENSTIDTSTTKYPTVNLLKTVNDSIPVKASGAEIDTGTDDAKFATAKALADSKYITYDGTETLTNKTLTKPVINGTNPTGATYAPSSGAQTVALDCAANNMHIVTGNASGTAITFTVANATNNQPFIVSILQGSTPSTIAGWFATIRWAGGTAPTLTPTANKRDTFGFIRTGANTYDGFIIGQNA